LTKKYAHHRFFNKKWTLYTFQMIKNLNKIK
jgi:hypothetical protein